MSTRFTRRAVIRNTAVLASGALIARFSHAQDAPVVDMDSPTALSLGYVDDHTQVDPDAWPKKAGPDGAKQHCSTCVLYKDIDGEFGWCPVFAGERVHAAGWCNSYTPA